MKQVPLIALLCSLMVSTICAAEHWVIDKTAPWVNQQSVTAVGTFKNDFIFVQTNGANLWKNGDATTWEPVIVPELGYIRQFVNHKGALYALSTVLVGGTSNFVIRLFRAVDGQTWQRVPIPYDDSVRGGAEAVLLYAYKEKLVFYSELTGPYVSTTEGALPVWNTVPAPGPSTVFSAIRQTIEFGDHLYARTVQRTGDEQLVSSSDGITWSAPLFPPQTHVGEMAVHNDSLYFREPTGIWVYRRPELGASELWQYSPYPNAIPLVIHGALHAQGFITRFGPSGPFMAMTAQNSWEIVKQTTFPGNLIHFKDLALFVHGNSISTLKKGVVSVDPAPYLLTDITAGQNDAIAFACALKVNVEEIVSTIAVENEGTAVVGDISRLRVLRRQPGLENYESIVDLVPQANGRSWTTPVGFSMTVHDGDCLYFAVSVNEKVDDNKSVQLAIPSSGIQFSMHSNYQSTPLMAANAQTINRPSAAAALVDGIVIYPNPTRDTVRFLYDLPTPSTVLIQIYDLKGGLVAEINEADKPANSQSMTLWDASSKAPGVYYAVIKICSDAGGEQTHKKKVFIER